MLLQNVIGEIFLSFTVIAGGGCYTAGSVRKKHKRKCDSGSLCFMYMFNKALIVAVFFSVTVADVITGIERRRKSRVTKNMKPGGLFLMSLRYSW